MNKKIAIIGAGISGLSAANMLKAKNYDVVVFEKKSQPGGLVSCSFENGVLFHRVGGHVFNSKNPAVLDWFWQFFVQDEFCKARQNSKIWLFNQFVGYPIENNLYALPKEITTKVIDELLELENVNQSHTPSNFEDFLRGKFGNTLYELYFKPYNEKIWRLDLKTMPLEWLDGKLPMPNIKEIFMKNIYHEKNISMVHNEFFYPLKKGSQFIADRLAENINILYNQSIDGIFYFNNQWIINESAYDYLVYTGDVRDLRHLFSDEILPLELKNRFSDLRSNGTSNVLCETDKNDFSWLYCPEQRYKPHRIIFTGNFSPNNNGKSARNTCTIEYSGLLSQTDLTQAVESLPGNNKVLAYNYEKNSYIIHSFNTEKIIADVRNALEPKRCFLLGRFAEWQYYNMDKAMEAAMRLSTTKF